MTSQELRDLIESDFITSYHGASNFVNSGALWDFCISLISDINRLNCVIFANDMGIPPVKSALEFYYREKGVFPTGLNEDINLRQSFGALWGFIFKNCLDYKSQHSGCLINYGGIKTATKFTDGNKSLLMV